MVAIAILLFKSAGQQRTARSYFPLYWMFMSGFPYLFVMDAGLVTRISLTPIFRIPFCGLAPSFGLPLSSYF